MYNCVRNVYLDGLLLRFLRFALSILPFPLLLSIPRGVVALGDKFELFSLLEIFCLFL